jgi:outer membrane receptor protein involved in Fe transport
MIARRAVTALRIFIVVTLILLAGRMARAADVADEAQFHFVRGNQFYRLGQFDDALSEFYASNRLVPNRNVQFNIARCLEQLKLYDEAFRAWSELLRTSPPASERTAIEGSIDKLRPHLALLLVTSEPPGAEIYANRRDLGSLGSTPKLLALPPGKVTVILELPGFRPVSVPVELARGAKRDLTPVLERIFGALAFRNLPEAAVVRTGTSDGPVLQRGPGTARVVPGRHVLFVSAPGYGTARIEVDVAPDAATSVDVPLSALPAPVGAVVVRANVDGALVRIDGREMGFTPAVIEGVLSGERQIEVSREGRETFQTVATVRQGERTYLDVRLRRQAPEITAATKSLVRAEDAPASISIVTADEIRTLGYLTLGDALRGIRGVITSNDRTYEAIGFQGLSPPGDYTKRVLVLVDGHPYNDIIAGQGYVGHDLDVDLENVERIEVVRGPGSVLYGTGALFGVINVVTRRPAPGVHADVATQIGTLGMNDGRATASVREGSAEVMASGAIYDATGDRKFTWSDGSVAALADGERAKHADLTGRVGPLSLRAGFNDRTKTVPTGVFATRPEAGTTYRDERAYAELRLDLPIKSARLEARAAYDNGQFQGHYLQLPTPGGPTIDYAADDFHAQWATGELRLGLPALAGHHLTVGGEAQEQFEVRQRSFDSTGASYFDSDAKERIVSGYLVDDWTIGRRLRVNAGLRADDYTKSFGATLNPRLAVIAQPYARGNTKLLLGRAFRAPSAYERFYNDMGVTQIAAGTLAPETILSAEIEHAHAVDDDLHLVVAGFAHQLSNMIVLAPTAGNAEVFQFQNISDRVRAYGAEGEVRWEPGAGTLVAFAYSWQQARVYASDGAHPLPNAPAHLAALRVIYPLVGSFLRVGNEIIVDVARHTADGDLAPDAFTWNLTLSGEHRPWRLRYFAGIFNLLDDRGGYPVGTEVGSGLTVPRYGRTARLGLAFAF